MKAVYFFCTDRKKDNVAPRVFEACMRLLPLSPSEISCDGASALTCEDPAGNTLVLIRTQEVVSHAFEQYLPILRGPLCGFDIAGIVNWHEGSNAPDKVFCVHTNGEVCSGIFPVADPIMTTAVMRALEHARLQANLVDWQVTPEATHFSGTQYGSDPRSLLDNPVPLIDIEIGSSRASWENPSACEAMTRGLVSVFASAPSVALPILYVGGVHFEPILKEITAASSDQHGFALSHILPNQWVVAGGYEEPTGLEKLRSAAVSVRGGVKAMYFHDKLKGMYKATVKRLASEMGIPAMKHKRLREGLGEIEIPADR